MNLELKNDCFELQLKMAADCCCNNGTTPVTSKIDPTNPENPFDEIGEAHNKGLAYLKDKFSKAEIVIQDDLMVTGYVFEDNVMLRASLEFLQDYPFQLGKINDVLNSKQDLFIKEIGQWDPRPGEIPIGSEFPVDTVVAVHDWMERLDYAKVPGKLFARALGAIDRGQIGTQEFIDNIKKIEAAAKVSELSEDDKNRVYVTASVARHSAAFWHEEVQAAKVGGPIGSDMKGAASGAAAGFITGVGILVGGLLGGLTRSATHLLAKKVMEKA